MYSIIQVFIQKHNMKHAVTVAETESESESKRNMEEEIIQAFTSRTEEQDYIWQRIQEKNSDIPDALNQLRAESYNPETIHQPLLFANSIILSETTGEVRAYHTHKKQQKNDTTHTLNKTRTKN